MFATLGDARSAPGAHGAKDSDANCVAFANFDTGFKDCNPMSAYRKKPVIIDAFQFFYTGPTVPGVFYPPKSPDGKTYEGDAFVVTIHDQRVYLANGDWVIAEPDGEHYYPCKPDIFEDRYEAVED